MEESKGVLVDTNILVSKKLKSLLTLQDRLYVTPVVVVEYLNWAIESRNKMLSEGSVKRAKGYERLIRLFPSLLRELGVGIIEQSLDARDLGEAIDLVLDRGVGPGDALNAVTIRKEKLKVVTRDKDWEKLRDYAVEVIFM